MGIKVPAATLEVNKREIIHLCSSPAQIFMGFNPVETLERKFPVERQRALVAALSGENTDLELDEIDHSSRVIDYVVERARGQSEVLERSDRRKDRSAERHDLGIRGNVQYAPGALVMLFDHRQAGKKLRPSWRGPFVITGFGGDMGKSYTIRQISGKKIPRHFHGDSLKKFRLREGYLITKEEELPVYQNIHLQKSEFNLLRNARPQANNLS